MKRLVVVSDFHCGHRAGLAPPDYHFIDAGDSTRQKYARMQKSLWDWYSKQIEALKPIDALVVNGDAIDGRGEASGGSELIVSDRSVQIKMAEECIKIADAKKIHLVYGTPYHTGKEEDWEAVLADNLNAGIDSHLFLDVDGVVFDFKHKVGSSSIPHGRHTAPARERLWNALWAERGLQPKANIMIRSHVHYYTMAGDSRGMVFTTPALQGPGSKYGARQCSGTIDMGFIVFDCDNGAYTFEPMFFDMAGTAKVAVKV